jgi:serine protease SohB
MRISLGFSFLVVVSIWSLTSFVLVEASSSSSSSSSSSKSSNKKPSSSKDANRADQIKEQQGETRRRPIIRLPKPFSRTTTTNNTTTPPAAPINEKKDANQKKTPADPKKVKPPSSNEDKISKPSEKSKETDAELDEKERTKRPSFRDIRKPNLPEGDGDKEEENTIYFTKAHHSRWHNMKPGKGKAEEPKEKVVEEKTEQKAHEGNILTQLRAALKRDGSSKEEQPTENPPIKKKDQTGGATTKTADVKESKESKEQSGRTPAAEKDKKETPSSTTSGTGDGGNTTATPIPSNATSANAMTAPPQLRWQEGSAIVYSNSPNMYRRQVVPIGPTAARPLGAPPATSGTVLVEVIGAIGTLLFRFWFVKWLANKVNSEEEFMHAHQHFVWEIINDRYKRDVAALKNVLSQPPRGISARAWKRHQNEMRPKSSKIGAKLPTKTIVVVDVTPDEKLDLQYLSDVVTFLLSQNAMKVFGENPEVVLLLYSPGGAVATYGLAASQFLRLRQGGMETTVCVDKIAASGGYMMASQASRIVAAPFASVGSIGVIVEGLNFNKLLNTYGITPLHITAGDNKRNLSTIKKVTDDDLKAEQKKMNDVHRAFIDWCLQQRPDIDKTVCDGTVLMGVEAQEAGLIDKIQTSDDYIFEKVQAGEHVLMLHKSQGARSGRRLLSTLDILPNLKRIPREEWGAIMTRIVQTSSLFGMGLRAARRYWR